MKDLTNGVLEEELKKAETEKNPTLLDCINRLKRIDELHGSETTVMKDFAPRSFYFERFVGKVFSGNGGIIYHGVHDHGGNGGFPTFSVSIDDSKESRWEIHT